jgi:lysozyme
MTRRINADGLKLIKQWEGLVTFAYDDFDSPKNRRRIKAGDPVRGTLTIGYGSTGAHVRPGMVISEREAEELLRDDLDRFERAVDRLVRVPLTDNQFAALVAFAFNVGEGNGGFATSTLLKKLNAGDYGSVPSEMMKWVSSKGKRMQGLVNRRSAEAGLWARGSFVASNTVEAKPTKPPVVTVDNAVKVATPLSALLQSFTSGPAQVVLAAAFALGVVFLLWRWHLSQREAAS